MNVILKDGTAKKYNLTLKMMGEGSRGRWHYVDYECILEKLVELYPELKNNIDRAYL